MPANITVAVNPIMGVATRMPSSTTVDTGRTIPNPNPAVKTAKKQAYIGLIFSNIESLYFLVHYLDWPCNSWKAQ
jgi:hypothetical protein